MNIASKSQAENGNDNETLMTPLRVKQSIKANAITPGSALDYSVLENKPKINNVELSGNKSSNELGIKENVQADWNTIDSTDGSYINNKPTIPTVNNATLTIQKNGSNVKTFTANASSDVTANITVPTKTSELTNDSNFATESYVDNLIEPLDERVNGEATEELTNASSYSVDNTLDMPFKDVKQLLGNTTQASTPTPSSPQEVVNVTGRQEIKTVGKNLFNKDTTNYNKGYYLGASGNTTSGTNWGIYYIPVQSNTAYTISGCTANTGVYFWWLDSKKNALTLIGSKKNYTNITSPSNAKYIGLSIVWNTTSSAYDGTTFMLEQNSSATTYEPYQEQVNEINLGKNLWNSDFEKAEYNTSGTKVSTNVWLVNTNKFNVQPNTTYTISQSEHPIQYRIICFNNNTYLSKIDSSQNATTGYSSYSFTTPTNCNGIYIQFRSTIERIATGTYNVEYGDITQAQLERGTQATQYSEYFTPIELCKIGTYEDKIFKTTGKNLFDKDDNTMILNSVYVNTSTGKIQSASNSTCVYIKCKSNTTYTISKTAGTRFVVGSTNETPTLNLILNKYTSNANASYITFKTGANDTYLVAWIWSGGTDTTITSSQMLASVQIEKSSLATEYEPYGSGEWYVKKAIAKRVLNGTENWGTIGDNRYWLAFPDKRGLTSAVATAIYSNYFKATANAGGTVGIGEMTEGYYTVANYNIFFNYNGTNTDLAGFKTWLSTHNTIVYYVLGTPTYEKLNDTLQKQLNTLQNTYLFKGQTNIIVDGNLPAIIDFIVYKDNVEGKYESLKSMFQKIINMIESG